MIPGIVAGLALQGSGADPYFSSVSALLHMDGVDASSVFSDVTGKSWTAFGNAQIDTAVKKYGSGSGKFDGSGDYVSTASDAGFGFGTGDYTVEGWAIRPAASGEFCLFDNRGASNTGIGVYAGATSGGDTNQFVAYSNTAAIAAASTSLPDSVWFHWAVCRQGATLRGYIDGVQQFSGSDSRTYASSAAAFVGANYLGTQGFAGNIDDLRVTKGVCRYPNGTSFTPPAAAFPDYGP